MLSAGRLVSLLLAVERSRQGKSSFCLQGHAKACFGFRLSQHLLSVHRLWTLVSTRCDVVIMQDTKMRSLMKCLVSRFLSGSAAAICRSRGPDQGRITPQRGCALWFECPRPPGEFTYRKLWVFQLAAVSVFASSPCKATPT